MPYEYYNQKFRWERHYFWLGLGRDDIWDEWALKGFQHADIVGHF